MRILVTGGAGFIGSALVLHLVRDLGHEVVTVDAMTYAANPRSLAPLKGDPRHRLIEADICDAPRMRTIFGEVRPEAVMHLAAESHVDRSITGSGAFVRTNVLGTHALLEAARSHFDKLSGEAKERFRFLHVSTDEVFGSLGEDGFFVETTAYDPRSPYSASKAASDHLVSAWGHTYGLPVLISNCSNNYGPRHFPEKLIPLMILNAFDGQALPLYGDGLNVRDWLHVEDHARALATVVAKGRPGETYAIGARSERTNKDVAHTLCAILDRLRPEGAPHRNLITPVRDRPGHDRRYAIDPTKIETELGWRPQVSFEDGLEATVRWYLDNEDWWRPLRSEVYSGERLGLLPAMTPPILVCGRRGQVATDLVEAGRALHLPLVALGRPDLDLTDPDGIDRTLDRIEPRAVINAAAYTAVDRAESEPDEAYALNRDGPARLARACAARRVPLIHISTDQVFDGCQDGGLREDHPPNPLCVYGASKLAGERAVAEAGGAHLIVRVSWVFGPSGDNFVTKVLGWAASRDSLSIVSDQRGRPTYSPGLARALLDLARDITAGGRERPRGLLHLAGGSVMTRFEQAQLILAGSAERGGPTARVAPVPTAAFPVPAARPLNAELDVSRARARYGLTLDRFEDDLETTLDHLLGQRTHAAAGAGGKAAARPQRRPSR